MDLVTLEDWGEEIFAKEVGMTWNKWAKAAWGGEGKCSTPPCLCTKPLQVKQPIDPR